MATSGQEQVAECLPLRPSHEWNQEDVVCFLQEMGLRDSVIETFKRKRKTTNPFKAWKLTEFPQRRESMERIFYSTIGLKLIYLIGTGNMFYKKKNGELTKKSWHTHI